MSATTTCTAGTLTLGWHSATRLDLPRVPECHDSPRARARGDSESWHSVTLPW